jgi:anti-anti-sigma regulatory factor
VKWTGSIGESNSNNARVEAGSIALEDGCRLSISVDHQTVRVTGVLDAMTIDLVLGTTSTLLSRGEREVTIDLNDTTSIDSTAVRELFTAQIDALPRAVLRLIAPARLRPRLAICVLDGDIDSAGTPITPRRGTTTRARPANLPLHQATQHRRDSA